MSLPTFAIEGEEFGIAPKQLWATDVIGRVDPRIALYVGSIRSGKTMGALFPWARHVYNRGDRGQLIMIGKSLDSLERNVLTPAQNLFGDDVFSYKLGNRSANLDGHEIHLLSAYNRRSFKKLRGMTCAGWLGDEVTLWPQNFFDELLGRMSPKGAMGIGTTNPDHPNHWLWEDWLSRIKGDSLDWLHFRFRLEDNPFLESEFVKQIEREYQGLYYQRLVLGMWVMAAGAIYDMFNSGVHVRDCPQGFDHYGVSVDKGTVNPTTYLLFGWDDPRERIHLLDCYFHEGGAENESRKTNPQYADDFEDFLRGTSPEAIVVDPSAADFIAELRERGFEVQAGDNDVINGINFTAGLLGYEAPGEERLWVNDIPSTKPVRKEFQSYVWDERDGVQHNKPVKENDHTMDALRYFLYTVIAKRIRNRKSSPPVRSRVA
jgi:PBSX family phage terminase large subunit